MKEFAGKKFLLVEENSSVPLDLRVWREAQTLRNAGAQVFVICPIFRENRKKFEVIDGIRIYRYPSAFSNGTAFGYFKEYMVAFIMTTILIHKVLFRHFPIHVLHAANPPDIFWPFGIYLKMFKTKFVFDEHDLSPETFLSRFNIEENKRGLLFRILRFMQRMSYKVSDAIISTNESYRAKAANVSPAYASKTFVVRNGPDTRLFYPRQPNASWKKGRSFLAAFIGVMAVQDGVDYIIRAADIIVNKKKFKDFIIYLIGAGDEVSRLRQLARQLKLDDFIIFTGFIPYDQALEILSTADVCLSPDPHNPLNDLSTMNKIMEYMALSKPIVSFDLKEARYSAGESAIYVENNSDHAFAEGILRLFNDPQLSKKMGEIGRRRIEEKLNWQKQEPALFNVYDYVLSRYPRRYKGQVYF